MQSPAPALLTPLSFKQFLLGLIGCFIGIFAGFLSEIIISSKVYPDPSILSPLVFSMIVSGASGIIAGAIQGGFLRRTARPFLLWLALSGTGWALAAFVTNFIAHRWPVGINSLPLYVFGIAAAVLPQCFLLRRSIFFAACWLVLSASMWGIVAAITYAWAVGMLKAG